MLISIIRGFKTDDLIMLKGRFFWEPNVHNEATFFSSGLEFAEGKETVD